MHLFKCTRCHVSLMRHQYWLDPSPAMSVYRSKLRVARRYIPTYNQRQHLRTDSTSALQRGRLRKRILLCGTYVCWMHNITCTIALPVYDACHVLSSNITTQVLRGRCGVYTKPSDRASNCRTIHMRPTTKHLYMNIILSEPVQRQQGGRTMPSIPDGPSPLRTTLGITRIHCTA